MKLNRTGSNWTELERNKINENWDILEKGVEVDIVDGSVTSEKIADEAITREKLSPELSGFNDYRTVLYYDDGELIQVSLKNVDELLSDFTWDFDNQGRLSHFYERAKGKVITTEFFYNSAGNLVQLRNSLGDDV